MPEALLTPEVTRTQQVTEVIIRVASIQSCDEVCEGTAGRSLGERPKRARAREVHSLADGSAMRFGKRRRNGKSCFVLILETLFDGFVQLFVGTCCLCSVKITAPNNMRISGIEV